jgi:hypothetical protein
MKEFPMTDEQYERLKRFLGLYFDWYMKKAHTPPTAHPLAEMELWEKKAPARVRRGLLIAINDIVERSSDWSLEEVADADRRLIENSAPSLSEIRKNFSKQYQRILKRGSIKSLEEYYLVKGIVDGGAVEVDASERANLAAMLGSFETQATPGCEE